VTERGRRRLAWALLIVAISRAAIGFVADRLSALGGALSVRSAPGAGTTVAGTLPIGAVR